MSFYFKISQFNLLLAISLIIWLVIFHSCFIQSTTHFFSVQFWNQRLIRFCFTLTNSFLDSQKLPKCLQTSIQISAFDAKCMTSITSVVSYCKCSVFLFFLSDGSKWFRVVSDIMSAALFIELILNPEQSFSKHLLFLCFCFSSDCAEFSFNDGHRVDRRGTSGPDGGEL